MVMVTRAFMCGADVVTAERERLVRRSVDGEERSAMVVNAIWQLLVVHGNHIMHDTTMNNIMVT